MKNASGMFITFEGICGSGKSTLVTAVSKYIESLFYHVVQTELLDATGVTKAVRGILSDSVEPRTEMFLQQACRADFIKTVLVPAICNGSVVICENYTSPVLAQFGENDKGAATVLNTCSAYGVIPDVTFILDVSPSIGKQRSEEEHLKTAECARLRKAYRKMANEPNCYLIDAERPLTEVFDSVLDILDIGENPEMKNQAEVQDEIEETLVEVVEEVEDVNPILENPILDEHFANVLKTVAEGDFVKKNKIPYIYPLHNNHSDTLGCRVAFLQALDDAVDGGLPVVSLSGVNLEELNVDDLPKVGEVLSYIIDKNMLYFNVLINREVVPSKLGVGEVGPTDAPKILFVYLTNSNGELV